MTLRKKPIGLPPVQCTPKKRKAILIYHEHMHLSFHHIANHMPEFKNTSADHTTISRAYKKAKDKGCYWKANRPGKKKVIDPEQLKEGIQALKDGEYTDGADLGRAKFPNVSPRTLRQSLRREGMLGFVRRKKVVLTIANFAQRHAFARVFRDWIDDATWARQHVVFSDESKFVIGGSDGLRWCRRERGVDVFSERCVSQRERRVLGRASVFVWGCMTREGPGNLARIEATMDRWMYIDILQVCRMFLRPYFGS